MIFLKKHHRDIILYKALCNLRSEASRTYLSFIWWVLEPLISLGIYYFVFGVIFQKGTEDYVPFLLIGLVAWQWFAQSVSHCSSSIVQNQALISSTHFPKLVLPSINIVMDTFKFLIIFLLLLITLWAFGYRPGSNYVYLPLILSLQLLLNYTIGIISAILVPFIPDMTNIIPHALRVLMYGSGILYAVSALPQTIQNYLYFNPMVWIIDSYRNILMYSKPIDLTVALYYGAAITILYITARVALSVLDRKFARVLLQR